MKGRSRRRRTRDRVSSSSRSCLPVFPAGAVRPYRTGLATSSSAMPSPTPPAGRTQGVGGGELDPEGQHGWRQRSGTRVSGRCATPKYHVCRGKPGDGAIRSLTNPTSDCDESTPQTAKWDDGDACTNGTTPAARVGACDRNSWFRVQADHQLPSWEHHGIGLHHDVDQRPTMVGGFEGPSVDRCSALTCPGWISRGRARSRGIATIRTCRARPSRSRPRWRGPAPDRGSVMAMPGHQEVRLDLFVGSQGQRARMSSSR